MGKLLERRVRSHAIDDVPELHDGDSMNSPEFLRRYEASKTVLKAELLNGIVWVHSYRDPLTGEANDMSPIGANWHAAPQIDVLYWLRHYALKTTGVLSYAPATVEFPSGWTTTEPDAILRLAEDCGGRATVNARDRLTGIPDLLVEVSHTTAGSDLSVKKKAYFDEGVSEYLVVRKKSRDVDWFVRSASDFVPLTCDGAVFKSRCFPGLWLQIDAMLDGNLDGVIDRLDLGIASPEHAKFVEKLRKAKARRK